MRVYWLIEPEMSASTTSGGWTSRGERNFGRMSSPPVRSAARIMARGSARRPCGSGRKRRVAHQVERQPQLGDRLLGRG